LSDVEIQSGRARDKIDIAAILLTHHHVDHVEIESYRRFDSPLGRLSFDA